MRRPSRLRLEIPDGVVADHYPTTNPTQDKISSVEADHYRDDVPPSKRTGRTFDVALRQEGGVFVVPVTINNTLSLNFIVDSGASDVSIPVDVVLTLMRTGSITQADFLNKETYTLADGSTVPSQVLRIRSLKVGDKVLENVRASVASVKSPLLLGQSFLSRFKSWRIDNARHALVLE
jgi:clan AA aspartic protease (TIGR02281 family)